MPDRAAPAGNLPPDSEEIEITPEMMRAGILAWAKGDDEFETDQEIVGRIFREMIAARKR